jgi:ankyrin repeat protein
VAPHQAGLADPKQGGAVVAAGLSSEEAWHHWQAGKAGVVDSARFLITFSMVPSVQTGGSKLHVAAALGHIDTVRQLLEDGARVDATKEDGTTALHSAATMGQAAVAAVLLEEGAWAEAVGDSGATPLMMAASMGHLATVVALLEGGASPNTAHAYGKSTALHLAAEVGRVEVVRELCVRGATVEAEKVTGGTALHSAADADQPEAVAALVEDCGADRNRLLMRDTTPLYLASQRGFTGVVVELLRLGADPNFVMPRGRASTQVIHLAGERQEGFYPVKNTEVGNGATALHAAVENGHLETARLLLEGGALQGDSMEGATPLVIALQYRHPAIALLLLEDGWPDPRLEAQVPTDGSSALLVAVTSGYRAVVERLLQRGADPDISTSRGVTPVLQAARARQDMLPLLLTAGASPGSLHDALRSGSALLVRHILDALPVGERRAAVEAREAGLSPLHLAVRTGRLEVVEAVLEAGAEVGAAVAETGATALHLAALQGDQAMVQLLVARGAEVKARAGDSLYRATPLYLAAQGGHARVVEELAAAGAAVGRRLWRMEATALHVAADGGHTATVAALLRLGATPHARNWNGVTALGLAAAAGRRDAVAALLAAGAQVNSRDGEGRSVLLQTLGGERTLPGVVRALLEAGADPGLAGPGGELPLLRAARGEAGERTEELVRALLAGGASAEAGQEVMVDGVVFTETALSAATARGDVAAVAALLEAGASPDRPVADRSWRAGDRVLLPLGEALRQRLPALAGLLLEHGARDCQLRGDVGGGTRGLQGCMQLAAGTRDPDTIKVLSDFIGRTGHRSLGEL